MTVKDVAEYFKLSSDLVYKLAQQGKIPVSKVGSQWRFKKEKIDEWMENQIPEAPKRRQSQSQTGSHTGTLGLRGAHPE
jgi:excisionase family DNA binding protein